MKLHAVRQLWTALNERHYGGALVMPVIRITRGNYAGQYCWWPRPKILIGQLNETDDDLRDTVLHEMVHLFLDVRDDDPDPDHGAAFVAEAARVGVRWPPREEEELHDVRGAPQ